MTTRIVFLGSPEFAVPSLRGLHQNFEVVGVITQPDRPSGRGRSPAPPPIKCTALELNIPIIQPLKIRGPEAFNQIKIWQPDLIAVAAYGQIIRDNILDFPQLGCINVHASLLPRWRGAAPIQAAILNGDTTTGITIMLMDAGLDTGPILSQTKIEIRPDDTYGSLSEKLAVLGSDLLIPTISKLIEGKIKPQPQDPSLVTYAPMLKKENGELDFTKPAWQLVNQVRAFNPWPGAYFYWKGDLIKIHHAHSESPNFEDVKTEPGMKMVWEGSPAIQTQTGLLVIDIIQPSGKKPMDGRTFLHGVRNWN